MSTIQVNKVTLSINNDKRMQTTDCRKAFADGATKILVLI